MKHETYNKDGFTLIELLVVVFIIGLVSTILIANIRKGEKQYQVQLATQEISQNIRRAQDMALTSFKHKPDEPSPYNFGVYFEKQSPNSYIIFADENPNSYKYNGGEGMETITLGSNIEIASLSSEPKLHITFSLPDGFTHIEPNADSANITIKRTGSDCVQSPQDCKTIEVLSTGQINVK